MCVWLYLQDLTSILFDLLQFEALVVLWVAVLLQVTVSGLHLGNSGRRSHDLNYSLIYLFICIFFTCCCKGKTWQPCLLFYMAAVSTHTVSTLQMWSLREPFSLNSRMSRADDSLVLENSSGQRYGFCRGVREHDSPVNADCQ